MKKILLVALVATISICSIFASSPDYKLSVGVNGDAGSCLKIEMNKKKNTDFSSNITMNLDTELGIFFKDGLGMNVIFATENFNAFKLAAGFAYNLPINSNWDFVISVGPSFGFENKNNTLGFYGHFDFDFIAGKYFFARLGTGLDIIYLTYGNGDAEAMLEMTIPVPRVAIGWNF